MASYIRRRKFLATLGGALAPGSLAACAPPDAGSYRSRVSHDTARGVGSANGAIAAASN